MKGIYMKRVFRIIAMVVLSLHLFTISSCSNISTKSNNSSDNLKEFDDVRGKSFLYSDLKNKLC